MVSEYILEMLTMQPPYLLTVGISPSEVHSMHFELIKDTLGNVPR